MLGLIFLKFADNKYKSYETAILDEYQKSKGKRTEKPISDIAIEKCGFYLPDHARYDYLLGLPEKQPKVLVQDWFRDTQTRKGVRSAVEQVLDNNLPESYDRVLFKEKCDNVFELIYDYASHGRKWAA